MPLLLVGECWHQEARGNILHLKVLLSAAHKPKGGLVSYKIPSPRFAMCSIFENEVTAVLFRGIDYGKNLRGIEGTGFNRRDYVHQVLEYIVGW